jgi:nucleotide-binding universal stress UspA family protein
MTGTQIVVGVDYSPASDAALAWALDAASRRQAELRIVHVCELSQRQLEALGESATRLRGQARDRGQRLLDDAVRIAGKTHPDVRVTPHLCLGSAARRLITESTRADVLVVGNLGLGEFAGLLLGSTALCVASFAHSTVGSGTGVDRHRGDGARRRGGDRRAERRPCRPPIRLQGGRRLGRAVDRGPCMARPICPGDRPVRGPAAPI